MLAKQFIPIVHKPILGWICDQIAETGITKVGIIIGPDSNYYVIEYVKDGSE